MFSVRTAKRDSISPDKILLIQKPTEASTIEPEDEKGNPEKISIAAEDLARKMNDEDNLESRARRCKNLLKIPLLRYDKALLHCLCCKIVE